MRNPITPFKRKTINKRGGRERGGGRGEEGEGGGDGRSYFLFTQEVMGFVKLTLLMHWSLLVHGFPGLKGGENE